MSSQAHSHSSAPDKPKSVFVTFVLGFFGFLIFSFLTLWLFYSNYKPSEDYEAIRGRERAILLAEVRKEANRRIQTVGWVDEATKVAHIPIDQAVAVTLATLSQKPIQASEIDAVIAVPAAPAASAAPLDAAASDAAAPGTADPAAAPGGEGIAAPPVTNEAATAETPADPGTPAASETQTGEAAAGE